MSVRRCPECRRPYASAADWQAHTDGQGCDDSSHCPWGGDRCWYEGTWCGWDAESVADLATSGTALRAGRPLTRVPHPHTTEETR